METLLQMSQKELKRIEVMQKLVEKRVSQAVAANLLQINVRQVKRLLTQYRQFGASGLISKRRGKPSNRRLPNNIKELRLQGISNVNEANAFLPMFIEDYNSKFAKIPLNEKDLHRSLTEVELNSMEDIFCWQEDRSLSNNLTLQYDKVLYLIEDSIETRKLAGKRVTVFDYHDGSIKIKYESEELPYRTFDKIRRVDPGAIVTNDRLG